MGIEQDIELLKKYITHPAPHLEAVLREALDRVESAIPRWRPMESAPKNGTYILGWDLFGKPYVCYWFGRQKDNGFWCSVTALQVHPTHFQPLPAPPEKEKP